MDRNRVIWNENVAGKVLNSLRKRNMDGCFVATADEAKRAVLGMIPAGATVYRGGSMSTVQLDLWPAIAALPQVRVIDPYLPGLSPAEGMAARREGLTADILLASSNAITLDGQLVNLDGRGNRVAAMMFGPEKVILVVGMNKLVSDLETAKARVKHEAAPINATRLGLKTPCVATGLCADCSSPQRICNMWSVIEGHSVPGRIQVVLVGEALGY